MLALTACVYCADTWNQSSNDKKTSGRHYQSIMRLSSCLIDSCKMRARLLSRTLISAIISNAPLLAAAAAAERVLLPW